MTYYNLKNIKCDISLESLTLLQSLCYKNVVFSLFNVLELSCEGSILSEKGGRSTRASEARTITLEKVSSRSTPVTLEKV